MKKILSNNHGYSLFIVVLCIAVFSILALSFTVQTANSKKQNDVVQDNFQSAALAEMGSQYYMTAIENEFFVMSEKAQRAQSNYINPFLPDKITEEIIMKAREIGINEAYQYLTGITKPTGIPREKIISNLISKPKFLIDNVIISPLQNDIVTITFDSIGMENGNTKNIETIITGKVEIDFSKMILYQPGEENYAVPPLILDPDPDDKLLYECSYDDLVDKSNGDKGYVDGKIKCNSDKTIFKIIGDIYYDKLKSNINLLYVTKNLVDYNGNSSYDNMKIHVKKDATIGNFNGSQNITLEVLGEATIKNYNKSTGKICAKSYGEIGSGNANGTDVSFYDRNNKACEGDSNNPGVIPQWKWGLPIISKEEYRYN
ncbi:hypothetical protein [Ureibacillus acetophenoni]|uniref:Uncharacterized protein n=1 Tax=Ureibacillus acetophenoni TaxID=614649 RepID=A0A285U8W4_9BACL|nr:hypothetical protein [Ureibacillus acetophenoni]SOC38282.1 hypothetical protein SAMN05877842_10482 [Ureibacillus acetophenoni]